MFDSLAAVVVAFTVTSVGYLLSRSFAHARDNLPPGPRRWPLIGSVLEMPRTYPWIKFSEWAKEYGNVVYLDVVGQPLVILNSAEVARDLLDRRSSIYSDRPSLTMATLSGYGESLVLQSYGENWRHQRKFIAQELGPSTVRRYHPLQEAEAQKFVHGLLDDPSTWVRQMKLRIGTIIIRVTYGHYITDEEDVFLTAPLIGMDNFGQATAPGAWVVDLLPMLKNLPTWAPGTGFLRTASQWRTHLWNATWNPYQWSKTNLESGMVLLPNLCATALEALDGPPSKEQEERLAWAASTVIGGGLDTNMSTVMTFFLAMVLNPSVQEKARKEIEAVIGSDRLPLIQDRESLPYIRSLMTEVFRWHPSAPLGMPHALRQDDVYDGMYLPKGSLVFPNMWHMFHNPEIYPNPMEFNPDRFQNLDSEMEKVTDVVFGFGRRTCPGKNFAEGTFFAIVSTLLATCEILPVVDAQGNQTIPDVTYSSGTVTFPSPFEFNVKCRSEKALELLAHGYPDNPYAV
ncbi:putative monooxygenase [Mycena latifolia]|nr:putative monooxygenase [Mycena latifolia]